MKVLHPGNAWPFRVKKLVYVSAVERLDGEDGKRGFFYNDEFQVGQLVPVEGQPQ